MQRDSVIIFGSSLLITLLIVGGVYYLKVVSPTPIVKQQYQPKSKAVQSITGFPTPQTNAPRWTNDPIKCFDEKVGEFWTNAKDCESADLRNRLSNAQPLKEVDYLSPGAIEKRRRIQAAAERNSSRNPSLRRTVRAVPSHLSISCKFAVGRALEIERPLSAADNPAESTWRENYCRWVNEARSSECSIRYDFFYYGHLCVKGLYANSE